MKKAALIFWLALIWAAMSWAQALQAVPPLSAHVIDQTGTLNAAQVKSLEDKLMALEQAKGTQIAVLMVGTTQPEDIASYANRVGNTWKIGRKEVGDGVLVVVAKNDRKVRIEVAKALEGAIPDLAAKQVIDEAITPNFRKGDFAAGLSAAIDQLVARVNGEALPPPKQADARKGASGFNWTDLAVFLFVAVPIMGRVLRGMMGRNLGAVVTGGAAGVIAMVLTSSLVIAGLAGLVALFVALISGGLAGVSSAGRGGWGGGPWTGGSGGSGAGFRS